MERTRSTRFERYQRSPSCHAPPGIAASAIDCGGRNACCGIEPPRTPWMGEKPRQGGWCHRHATTAPESFLLFELTQTTAIAMKAGECTRRDFLRFSWTLGAGLALPAGLPGCGGGGGDSNPSPSLPGETFIEPPTMTSVDR